MDSFAKSFLAYARASLADARCPSPDLDRDVVELTTTELHSGRLGAQAVRELFKLAKRERFDEENEERLWPIQLTVCPRVYALRPDHGRENSVLPTRIAPLTLFASIDRSGRLSIDAANSRPVIPRALLRPTKLDVTIGEVDVADRAAATLTPCSSWQEMLSSALTLLSQVSGQAADELSIESYERYPHALCKAESRKPAASNGILELIDLALTRSTPPLALYECLLRDRTGQEDHPIRQGLDLVRLSARHVGQMESRYGLSPSQRETLLNVLANEAGQEVVAIDGPPGTGKTTLLLSVIATNWVTCALANSGAPVTMATSTNNQSVLNVLEAFWKAGLNPNALGERWLSGIESYGIYLPARSREDLGSTKGFTVHTLTGLGKQAVHPALAFETPEGFERTRVAFLGKLAAVSGCSAEISLADAVDLLRARIAGCVEKLTAAVNGLLALAESVPGQSLSADSIARQIDQADNDLRESVLEEGMLDVGVQKALELRGKWKRHVSDEPWWVSMLAHFGLTSRRMARDEAFCAGVEAQYGAAVPEGLRRLHARDGIASAVESHLAGLEGERDLVRKKTRNAHLRLARLTGARDAVRACAPEPAELTLESVQTSLDVGPRHDAFVWATHYWEAKYLLELEQTNGNAGHVRDSMSREGLERQYRRLAKIWPCFVSTLYVLPARFTGWKQEDSPLYNVIDLLIVDEAGQVPPEVGAAAFMLAKRALVVGDVDQLEPIWGVSESVDGPNALRHGLVRDSEEADRFAVSGISASTGSLMRLAQRATPFAKYPDRGRGLFLGEHRRCLPAIIQICNDMVYGGRLIACRTDGADKSFPTVGYIHIAGRDEAVGQSRKNESEAHAIAQWLVAKKNAIQEAFEADDKPFGQLVSVITPFTAQARLIRATLSEALGKRHGIRVGTIHTLQGAECRLVIFSPTYGLGTRPGQTQFDWKRSMLNVTVSRAQDAFLVFGNMNLFQPGSARPSSFVANALFANPDNELDGISPHLLCPSLNLADGVLIADLPQHRAVLAEALATARSHVVIVSPFLASDALRTDDVANKIKTARGSGVTVRVVTDDRLNGSRRTDFEKCIKLLREAGAEIRIATTEGVHSKLLLVDRSWLVVGSFNWLSAVRRSGSPYRRYESSLQYRGEQAFDMIERSLTDLRELTRGALGGG